MRDDTRRLVAYFVLWRSVGGSLMSIYDHQERKRFLFSGELVGDWVRVLEKEHNQLVSGRTNGRGTLLLNHTNEQTFAVLQRDVQVTVHDFQDGRGGVGYRRGDAICLHDLADGRAYWFAR